MLLCTVQAVLAAGARRTEDPAGAPPDFFFLYNKLGFVLSIPTVGLEIN